MGFRCTVTHVACTQSNRVMQPSHARMAGTYFLWPGRPRCRAAACWLHPVLVGDLTLCVAWNVAVHVHVALHTVGQ